MSLASCGPHHGAPVRAIRKTPIRHPAVIDRFAPVRLPSRMDKRFEKRPPRIRHQVPSQDGLPSESYLESLNDLAGNPLCQHGLVDKIRRLHPEGDSALTGNVRVCRMRPGINIDLSSADRLRLEALVRDRNTAQKHVWRARIVLLSASGMGTNAIMRETGKSKTCVWRWQERFAEEGVEGLLRDKTRPSRIAPLPPEVAGRVVELTFTEPPAEATHWTGAMMAEAVGISVSSVHRIWRAHGLRPRVCPIICVSGAMGVVLSGLSALRPESDPRTGSQTAPSQRSRQPAASIACRRCGSPGTGASWPPRRWGSCPWS